jgi:MoaA/NifB/PqqE/SkfB family radical SAM enzyme
VINKNLFNIKILKNEKTEIKELLNNDVFCLAPWVHLYVGPNGSSYPCCNVDIVDDETSFGNIDNLFHEKIEKVKRKMINGEKINACQNCYKNKELNLPTYKDFFNENFKHILHKLTFNNIINFKEILSLDIRFSNKCNFSCKTCGPHYSSAWEKKLNNIKINNDDNENLLIKIKELILNNSLKHIYFAGGEPLIMDEHWELLNFIIDNNKTDINLIYSTNLSNLNYKNNNFVEKIKQIKNKTINISCDSLYEKGEYIRHGFKHKTFMKNINSFIDNKIDYTIICVLSTFNILYIKEFVTQLLELNLLKNNLDFNIPKEIDSFNPYFLTKSMFDIFISDINYLIELDEIKEKNKKLLFNLKSLKNDFLKNCRIDEDRVFNHTFNVIKKNDKIHKTSIKETLPELYEEIIKVEKNNIK